MRNTNILERQIRMRAMVDQTKGYTDGCIAARDNVINQKELNMDVYSFNQKSSEWLNGFNLAYSSEKKRVVKKMRKIYKKSINTETDNLDNDIQADAVALA